MSLVFISNKICNERSKHWECILNETKNHIYRYYRALGGEDVPYFYNERTNISILAAAATRKSYLTLEEYVVNNKRVLGQSAIKGNGRVDLWLGSKNLDFNEIVEAKQSWSFSSVEKDLNRAKKDCDKNRSRQNERKAAVVFCTPHYSISSKNHGNLLIKKDIMEKIEEIESSVKYDIALFMFPKQFRNIVGKFRAEKRYFPGLVILVKLRYKRIDNAL